MPTIEQERKDDLNDAIEKTALLVPCPELAPFVVTGEDRLSWLNGMLTCDLSGKKAGDAVYGLQVGLKGRIVSDVVVVVLPDRVLLLVQRAAKEAETALLDRHLMMEDALVEPAFDGYRVWWAHGPASGDVLSAARDAGAFGGVVDLTGLGGAVLVAPMAASGVEAALDAALAKCAGARATADAWDAIRVARGIPRFGVDFDAETYPQEAGLEKRAVSFSKGCYLGQEVVCMLELRGHVKRKLVRLTCEGPATEAVTRGAPVADEAGVAVGEVTSAAWSPRDAAWCALAMVKYAHANAGERLRLLGRVAVVA